MTTHCIMTGKLITNGSNKPRWPFGRERYYVHEGELRRRLAHHPGTQAHRNCLWVWL